jgi:prepilin-type N-terminal cleavage/methylation domain-containing protein
VGAPERTRQNERPADKKNNKMKLPVPGLNRAPQRLRSGFTLIEMIGVLAVIAILASMLIPRVFEAINSARVNATVVNCDTIKTAAADHYGKYGQFNMLFGTNLIPANAQFVVTNYDIQVLLPEGLLDKPFSAPIAGADINPNSTIQLVQGGGNAGTGYFLDGVTTNSTASDTFVLEAVLYNVNLADAKDLNDRIDGTALGAQPGQPDKAGRVEYSLGQNNTGPVTVYVYLTGR